VAPRGPRRHEPRRASPRGSIASTGRHRALALPALLLDEQDLYGHGFEMKALAQRAEP
jgi:hypothetical protein